MAKRNHSQSPKSSRKKSAPPPKRGRTKPVSFVQKIKVNVHTFLLRRPHRSFRRTRRRDYVRSLKLPGYIFFTGEVLAVLKRYRRTFLYLILLFGIGSAIFSGIASQETYRQLAGVLNDTGESVFTGSFGEIGKAGLLLTTSLNGTFRTDMTEAQQIYAFLFVLFAWLTTVWFLRNALAGSQTPKLRTAIYNAGAPIIPTAIIAIILILQLIPAALGVIAYTAAISTDFLSNPLISIVFFFVVLLLVLLSVYLFISTFFALIVVTLPGMYPWQAIRTAGDMVTGRRLRILLRLMWMIIVTAIFVLLIMIPTIIFVNWLQSSVSQIQSLPVIPIVLTFVSTASVVFVSSYIYLLYRKVLDDDATPA